MTPSHVPGRNLIRRLSTVLFYVGCAGLLLSATALFVGMHRNIFGPSGENMHLFRAAWKGIAGLVGREARSYPLEDSWCDFDWLLPAVGSFIGFYFLVLFALRYGAVGARIRLRTLLIAATVVAVPLLMFPHLWSSDVFDYIIYGRLAATYRVNPYFSAICEYPSDPFFNLTCWKMAPSVYGPAWNLVSIALVSFCELFSAGTALYVFVYKSFALACHLGTAAVIWRILGKARVGTAAYGTALYLFNPLALIEFAGNGHNEAFVILMLVTAVRFEQKGRWALAAAAFAIGVQAKLYVLPVFCLYVAYLWWREKSPRDAWTAAGGAALVFLAVSALLFLPFGLNSTTLLAHAGGPAFSSMTKSLGEFIVFKSPVKMENLPVIGWYFTGGRQEDVQRLALFLTFVVCVGGALYARTLSRLLTAAAFFAFWWSSAGATWFMPWYVTIALGLAPLSGSRAVRWPIVLLSCLVLSIYLVEGHAFSSTPALKNWMAHYYQVVVFLLPLALCAVVKAAGFLSRIRRICTLAPGSRPHGPSPQYT